MKKLIALSLVAMSMALGSSLLAAGKHKAKTVTVTGTLVDCKCYGMMHTNTGNDHMTPKGQVPACARACATMGIPVGVLKDGKPGGELIVLITPSPQLADHMAQQVRVVGMVPSRGSLIPEKIEVLEHGKWTEVKIATMM